MEKCQAVYFVEPHWVEMRTEDCPAPQRGEVLVHTIVSAVSAGTELLLYRGLMPQDMALDETIEALDGGVSYPLKYGYAAVGRVAVCGEGVEAEVWHGRLVFAFQPHQSCFCAAVNDVHPIPEGISPEDAIFLPNMETAVSFVMDGQPVMGEQVLVLGQGVVGLLTTALLAQFPLASLVTVDGYSLRREWSAHMGATESVDVANCADLPKVDLCYELSGNPSALNTAIDQMVFSGRIVVGSWYGQKEARLNLGGAFHRQHLQLVSSQVSHLHPRWSGRWDKARRLDVAWQMIKKIQPSRLITHHVDIGEADTLYKLLVDDGGAAVQTVFKYHE